MKYLNLDTYNDFTCIGSACPFTCCGGWRIVIDKKTASYYRSVKGEIGDKLKRCIAEEDGVNHFILTESGACPFLNERGLCDIYINLGEEHLSNTCTYYPRYTYFAGDIRFAGTSISCPEVARLFLSHKDTMQIDFSEDEADINDDVDRKTFDNATDVFDCAIDLARNRSLKIRERIALITVLMYQFQTYMDTGNDPAGIIDLFSDPSKYVQIIPQTGINVRDYESKTGFCSEIMKYFWDVDRLSVILPELYDVTRFFAEEDNSTVEAGKWVEVYAEFDHDDAQIWQEQLLVYVIYRYLMQGVHKKDYLKKYLIGLLLVFSLNMSIVALSHIKTERVLTFDERVMIISHVSRLIEHSPTFNEQVIDHFDEKGMTALQYVLKLMS